MKKIIGSECPQKSSGSGQDQSMGFLFKIEKNINSFKYTIRPSV